ncbi:hypothetical protein QUF72_22280 [Desulfobacterales bacterium HSG2]|nr:hypothetical protein [Desulfobacterales bacterium HSG2]
MASFIEAEKLWGGRSERFAKSFYSKSAGLYPEGQRRDMSFRAELKKRNLFFNSDPESTVTITGKCLDSYGILKADATCHSGRIVSRRPTTQHVIPDRIVSRTPTTRHVIPGRIVSRMPTTQHVIPGRIEKKELFFNSDPESTVTITGKCLDSYGIPKTNATCHSGQNCIRTPTTRHVIPGRIEKKELFFNSDPESTGIPKANATCHSGQNCIPNADHATCNSGQNCIPNADHATCHSGQNCIPNADNATCHSGQN